jgi:large subunit ribosomal protein L24
LKIEGMALVKKTVRANPQTNTPGSIVTKESFVDASNVMIFNQTAQKGCRIGVKLQKDDGSKQLKKVRCFKSGGELIEIGA